MLANLERGVKFPNMKLKALPSKNSDHTPFVLELEVALNDQKPFRNLDAWFYHPDFKKMVNQERQALGCIPIVDKICNLRALLRR